MKKLLYSIIVAASFFVAGCSKQTNLQFDGKAYYYQTNYSLFACDTTGTNWYQLETMDIVIENDAAGQPIVYPEQWILLSGNHTTKYRRTDFTRDDTNLPPVFIRVL